MRGNKIEQMISEREAELAVNFDRNCGTCAINHDLADPKYLKCHSATGYPMWQRGRSRANTNGAGAEATLPPRCLITGCYDDAEPTSVFCAWHNIGR